MNNKTSFSQHDLDEIIKECMGLSENDKIPPIIIKQITRFTLNDDMTYREIGRCVWYYINIRLKKIDPLYGIAFVLNIRQESNSYWLLREKKEASHKEVAKNIKNEANCGGNSIVFNIKEIIKHKNKPYTLQPLVFHTNVEDKEKEGGENEHK